MKIPNGDCLTTVCHDTMTLNQPESLLPQVLASDAYVLMLLRPSLSLASHLFLTSCLASVTP